MKHITIILIFGAVLQGCSENRKKEVSAKPNHKVQTETIADAPKATTQKVATVAPAMKNDKVSSGRAAPIVAVQKKPLRAMTFNEAQFSEKANTFPRTSEALKLEEEKYID